MGYNFSDMKKKTPIENITFAVLASLLILLAGCSPAAEVSSTDEVSPSVDEIVSATLTVAPTPLPTEKPSRNLVICLENEPESLYLYGSSSRAAASVLEAVYDGPFDVLNYEAQPVILQKLPAYADGDAVLQPADVYDGERVVDVNGDLVTLQAGVTVLPAGCTSLDCAVTWDGEAALQMDQATVTFRLLEGITWSDGAPLTVQDSVYSYKVATDASTPTSRQLVYRTFGYKALNDTQVQWTGVPGYFPERLDSVFWTPLPEHLWGAISPADLVTNEISSRYPIGWGPYVLEEWVAGDHITLAKNPAYFRAAEGLPFFDNLVYRFLDQEGDSLIAALQSKECDLIDQSAALESELDEIIALQESGELQIHVQTGPEFEQLTFGIDHSSYDDGQSVFSGDRADFFSDVRVRQAFAFCIDREEIVDVLLGGLSYVPSTYLPQAHPLFDAQAIVYQHDTAAGRSLLEQVGWRDWDGDPATPLQSIGVPNVLDNTFFSVNYYTTQAPLRQQIAGVIRESLGECGVEVNITTLTPEEIYAAGPQGPLFGRNFDLAQFSWSSGVLPLCQFYDSAQIPSEANNWLTLNIGGYGNAQFDAVCRASMAARPDNGEYASRQQAAQNVFAAELPVLPLYMRLKVALTRPDLCGLTSEVSSSLLWNLESLNYGEGCQ
jgi:peptide/nickel transport system substrate-binding protein